MIGAMLTFLSSIFMINCPNMSDQTSFISQIQEAEEKASEMLKEVEKENDMRLVRANEEAELLVDEAEEKEREAATIVIQQAKEEAKAEYSRLLTDANNSRRDVIEAGKARILKGKEKVVGAFMAMFE